MNIHAALGAFAVSIVIFLAGVANVGAVQDAYVCERVDGYNPAGATQNEKYQPGTWAALCMKNESATMAGYSIFMVGGLAGMAVSVVAMVRSG